MSMLDTLAGVHEREATQPAVVTPEVQEPAKATVSVIPYNACLDPQADAFLPWLWKKMQTDDLVDYYFPGQKDTGFATFVRLFSGDAQVALFKTEDTSAGNTWEDRIPGFITWSQTRMGASDVLIAGFIFFRKFWDHHTTDAAARAAFAHWFAKPEIKIVVGVCPSLHKAAIRYNQRIGLKEIGRIPMAHMYKGETCDAILYAITREQWEGRA
jgi:RimJ/RimL family protein N-acetyltransferase